MKMGFQKGKELDFVYEYDFAVSGGAVSSINLVNEGMNNLESGLIITDFTVVVETALTSGGSPTITLGNVGDTDGYMIDFYAAASAGAVLNRGDRAGALVWDDTNDHPIHYKIDSTANAAPSITVATAALTAGKFKVYFKAFKPLA
jgi:hypothetical protein